MIVNEILGTVIGGALGYLYYKKVGCPSGTCPITSNRYITIAYGALVGFMLSSSF